MRIWIFLLTLLAIFHATAQQNTEDSIIVKSLYSEALCSFESYNNLEYLCTKIGGRICGSPEAAAAVEFTYQIMLQMPFDTVYLQQTKVASWKRGEQEQGRIISPVYGQRDIHVCAMGGSVGTGFPGISSQVIEVRDIESLLKINPKDIKGKIVFFNAPFNQEYYYTFRAYGENASSRVHGASEAAPLGAVAVIVRSLTHSTDTFTHTGIMRYKDPEIAIPSFAISTTDADILSAWLKQDDQIMLYLESHCYQIDDVPSYNVIGEIKGSVFPESIITVGGHLDAWDNGQGAHDDGGGCMQSIEVARLFFAIGYHPQHTVRIVMFMDEEMNQRGAKTYASDTICIGEQHYFALESDRGVFTPTGFSIDGDSLFYSKVESWIEMLKPYGIWQLEKGYSGVDIHPLKTRQAQLAALITDSQRYFDYQHADSDTFDKVNRREMQLGSATMAAFVYFIDKYGIK